MSEKIRLDRYLVDHGLAPSRERAQALIMRGKVRIDGRPATKAGQLIAPSGHVEVLGTDHPFVGRGGVKLAHAVEQFHVDVTGAVCLDAGASTGGFTDCLLQRGAARVYAIDVGRGQLAWKLVQDPRVIVRDQTNLRTLRPEAMPEPIDLATLDLSFISLTKVFPAIDGLLKPTGQVIALIKPQFEVGKGRVGKGGIVRKPALHQEAIDGVLADAQSHGWVCHGTIPSPITGADGNIEFLVHLLKIQSTQYVGQ